MEEFIVPPVEEAKPLPTPKEASEQAFYAAAASKGNPIEDYMKAKMDLQTTGDSDFISNVKSQWDQEANSGNREAIEGIIGDPSVHHEIKKSVLRSYSLNGYVPQSLRDRYITKAAANDELNDTVFQKKAQDYVVANLHNRRAQMDIEKRNNDIKTNATYLQSFLGSVSHLYKGVGNTLGIVSDEEYQKGHEEYKKLAAANPISAGIGHAVGLIGGAAPALAAGGPIAAIFGSAAIGGSLQGAARFAELGQEGVAGEERLDASLASAGMTSAQFATPIFRAASFLKAMILNGGANVALGELDTKIQNTILEAYPELQQGQFDPKNMTVNGVFGALIGAVFGRAPKVNIQTPGSFPPGQARRPTDQFTKGEHTQSGQTFDGQSTRINEEQLQLNGPKDPEPTAGGLMIPPGSPADVTRAANPKVAESLGTSAIKDPSGVVAEAMGTDKGSIINDWVLPKAFAEDADRVHPDLSRSVQALDDSMKELFDDFRYDPNIVSATKRDEDAGRIYEAIKEIQGLHYQQANSVTNFTDFISEGKMVFGANPTSGFLSLTDAQEALRSLRNHINSLPADEQGVAGVAQRKDGTYSVTWNWKKTYDDAAIRTFGADSIQSSILGVDASALARSSVGNWLFHTGRFPDAVERGAMRGIERGTRLEDAFIKSFDEHVAGTKFGKELNHLIDEAESLGKEHFTKAEISSKFPDMTTKQVDKLFEAHTYWRRMQHYFYAFMNREYRHRLVDDGMQGLYNSQGDYLGPVSTHVTPADYAPITEIWSHYEQKPIKFDRAEIERNASQVVRLGNKVEVDGKIYEFGLIEGDLKVDMLPTELLPRVPGYSPRMVKENFFVDIIPSEKNVNGLLVKDPLALKNYSKTVAAVKTQREANALIAQAEADNPGWKAVVRPDRSNTFGRVITDYQVHTEMFRQSKKRGERVPSSMGKARIEDRLVTSIKMAQTLSRLSAFREWENTFRAAFTKGFGDFLPGGEFPQYKTDIKPLRNMTKEDNVKFQTAMRLFEYYSKQKTFETLGDHLWKTNLHNIADVLERWRVPAEIARKIGDKGNIPVKYAKMAATAAYIHLNPIRQWIIQPAQLMEMYAINPHTAPAMFKEMLAVRLALSGESNLLKPFAEVVSGMSRHASGLSPEEFNATTKAIKESGLLQSIDLNVLVHGMFKEVDRNLLENTPEKVTKDIQNLLSAPLRISRAVGFDAAELTNRIGLYLQAKEMWKQQNPGKNWNTKENKEVIAAEALRLSGLMNKAGNLPYQEGALSVFFQFAAISQKLTFNLLQDNATIMTPAQRARLAAVRAVLYGAKYGLPAGSAIYYFVERSGDEELKRNAEEVKRGLVDYTANNIIAAMVDPDTPSNLAISKSLTPYSEGFLPYWDFAAETVKLLDNKPSSSPRYPAFSLASSFGKAVDQMQGWFITREINDQSFHEAALEAAELASGFNNYSQGMLLLGMRDKVTGNGNALGEQYSLAEAYGKMFLGSQSQKEIDTYEMLAIMGDKQTGKKEMAQEIHKGLMNIRSKIGEQEADTYYQRLNSFMSLLPERHFNQQDRIDVIQQVLELDRRSYTSLKQSILADVWKYHSDKQTDENTRVLDILKRSPDPKTQEFVKLLEEGKL